MQPEPAEKSRATFPRGAGRAAATSITATRDGTCVFRAQRRHAQGERIYVSPIEVESALIAHEAVLEARWSASRTGNA